MFFKLKKRGGLADSAGPSLQYWLIQGSEDKDFSISDVRSPRRGPGLGQNQFLLEIPGRIPLR